LYRINGPARFQRVQISFCISIKQLKASLYQCVVHVPVTVDCILDTTGIRGAASTLFKKPMDCGQFENRIKRARVVQKPIWPLFSASGGTLPCGRVIPKGWLFRTAGPTGRNLWTGASTSLRYEGV